MPSGRGFVGGQGYQADPDSGLLLLGARYYDPSLGRFLSRDPIRYAGGDVNLYRYCANDPVNATDPSGLDWLDDASNFSAGWGDTLVGDMVSHCGLVGMVLNHLGVSYTLDDFRRDIGVDVVDTSSPAYQIGEKVGITHNIGMLLAGGASVIKSPKLGGGGNPKPGVGGGGGSTTLYRGVGPDEAAAIESVGGAVPSTSGPPGHTRVFTPEAKDKMLQFLAESPETYTHLVEFPVNRLPPSALQESPLATFVVRTGELNELLSGPPRIGPLAGR